MADPPSTDSSSSSSSATQIKRKGFNWQFIGIEPTSNAEDDLGSWDVDRVEKWLNSLSLNTLAEKFKKQDIDGSVMKDLSEEDLSKGELDSTIGIKKKFFKERDELIKAQASKKQAANGVVLPKGFLPLGEPLSAADRDKVKFNKYNAKSGTWVPREVPLSSEELECWDYQAKWLMCPVTKDRWFENPMALLGVGLYHAPRFLSDPEMQRAINDELSATQDKQKKRDEKAQKNTAAMETTAWSKNFQVYPSVIPPPTSNIPKLTVDVGEVPLGPMQVIIGPAFNIDAYNYGVTGNEKYGIRAQKERGVLSMDQQYNAFNFVYYVLRSNDLNSIPSYERKICTSRLSFYIDEYHGSRVFPSNIESQLSLFIYRDNRLSKRTCPFPEEKRMQLLAAAIKKMIPHVLKAVIMEVVNGRATAVDEIIEYSLRTYLLVHQVSIKLILYYRTAYELLYSSIIRWIQNPFSAQSNKEWPDLEELLIGASLVGISWPMLRESFVRKFLHNLIMLTPRKEGSHKQWIDHIFHNHKAAFHTILYEFSFFFTANRPLVELDRTYLRCAGSLPKAQRDAMKEMVNSVAEANTFQEIWLRLGMDVPMDDYELTQRIGNFLTHLITNATNWGAREVVPTTIRVPEHEDVPEVPPTSSSAASSSSSSSATAAPKPKDLAKMKKEREEQLAIEKANHEGYPDLNKKGSLDSYACNYPKCGKVFKCRDALFRHLNAMIPPERMIRGFHQKHFTLTVSNKESLTCEACKLTFPTIGKIQAHYRDKGVPGVWNLADRADDHNRNTTPPPPTTSPAPAPATTTTATTTTSTPAPESTPAPVTTPPPPEPKSVDPYEHIGMCVICMDKSREVVNVPCGHMICCSGCATKTKLCPMCRAEVKDHVVVYYS